jgi:hypothetical protein
MYPQLRLRQSDRIAIHPVVILNPHPMNRRGRESGLKEHKFVIPLEAQLETKLVVSGIAFIQVMKALS